MSDNVIIVDENFLEAASQIEAYGCKLGDALRELCDILEYVTEYAVLDEKIRQKIITLREQTIPMETDIREQSKSVQDNLELFISKIDEVDQFLY